MGRAAQFRVRPGVSRRRNGAQTRAAILEAAQRIFAEAGLAGARTDALAAAAGVNKALLYYYFHSKQGLYGAVLEQQLAEFYRQALQILSVRGPAGATLLRYVSNYFDFIAARPHYPLLFLRVVMGRGRQAERIVAQYLAPLAVKLQKLIRRGMRSEEFRPLDPRHVAISLVSLTVFYFIAAPVVHTLSGTDPLDKANLARRKSEVLKFVRFALFRNPEASRA